MLHVGILLATLAIMPDNAELLIEAKDAYEKFGRCSQDVIDDLRTAVKEEPQEVDLRIALGHALLQEEPEKGLKSLRKALKLGRKQEQDTPPSLQQTVVQQLMKVQKYTEAHAVYESHGHEMDSGVHQSLSLHLALGSRGPGPQAAAARVHAEKAIAIAPDDPNAQLSMGFAAATPQDEQETAEQGTGRLREAEVALRKAFRLREKAEAKPKKGKEKIAPLTTELQAHARHLLGSMILHQAPPEENSRLQEALHSLKAATTLLPNHEPYQEGVKECARALVRRKHHEDSKAKQDPWSAQKKR
eukprot:458462-Prymnesium_polylepis.1